MTQEPSDASWPTRLALAIASEVRRHRQAQRLSAQQLSDRCAELGMPIQRSVLANLESGRRTTVTVAEVLVLAEALEVAPAALMFPAGYSQEVEVLPSVEVSPLRAVDWLGGYTKLSGFPKHRSNSPLVALRRHREIVSELRTAIREREKQRAEALLARRRATDVQRRQQLKQVLVLDLEEKIANSAPEAADLQDELEKRHAEVAAARAEAAQAEQAAEFMEYKVEAGEDVISLLARRLGRAQKQIEENGWLAPPLPEEVWRIVQQRADLETLAGIRTPPDLLREGDPL
ncbi:helix-turn-helix domain-containing protein [Streptomyces griseus]|uniref:helix-turn-helix domain-containing protein n=1 Tax=Streptomyces griseus TaxID=1911 RepID=UPI0037AB917A